MRGWHRGAGQLAGRPHATAKGVSFAVERRDGTIKARGVRLKTVEVLDLDREQKLVLELATERELWWGTALYLGPRYLMLTLRGTRGVVGLRRYDLGEVEGWTPVDVEPAEGGS